jgi:ribose transport system substrate-binding protein
MFSNMRNLVKKLLRLVAVFGFLMLLIFSGCKGGPKEKIRFAVVPKTNANPFWLTVKAGAEQAAKESGVEIIWKGPAEETDIAGQVAIIEDFINKKVDALVMAACDAKALVPTVKKAVDAGIPVITIDSDVDSDLPLTFIATDNILGGKKAAQILSNLIGAKGKVGLIPFIPGAATSIMREKGFKDEISKYPDIELVSTLYCYSDAARGMSVTEDMLTSHPDLNGIFAANEPGAAGCVQALKSLGFAGKVKLVGFDSGPTEIEELKKGNIQALIVQNPYKMGYLGVKAAVDAVHGKSVEKRIDTGVTVVTMENFNEPEIQKILFPLK